MSFPSGSRTGLVELDRPDGFEFLYPRGSNEAFERIRTGQSPMTGQDTWAIGVVVKDHLDGVVDQEETELEYEPEDAQQLKRDYRRSYKNLVTPLVKLHETGDGLKDLEEIILLNTLKNMSPTGARLLGGFCVARGEESGQIFPSVFYSKTLASCYGRMMRETALAVDLRRDIPPELEVSEEELELFAKAANMEQLNDFSVACGGIVASLLPHPATVSPTFGQGPRPLI